MRYYTKTLFGIFTLVCLALIAVALNEAAVKTAAKPSRHTAVQIIEPDHTPVKELRYEDPEAEVKLEQTVPIYDIPLSTELQEYTYNRCEELGLVAPGVD